MSLRELLPHDVFVHHLLTLLTIQDKLALATSHVPRNWRVWTRHELQIDVRDIRISAVDSASGTSVTLKAKEQVMTGKYFVLASDRWMLNKASDDDDDNTYEHSNRYGHYLGYYTNAGESLLLRNRDATPRYFLSQATFALSIFADAQDGMANSHLLRMEIKPECAFEVGETYKTDCSRLLLSCMSDDATRETFSIIELRISLHTLSLLCSSARMAAQWISVFVLQTDAQQDAWHEVLAWYGHIRRQAQHATAKEMYTLAKWCLRSDTYATYHRLCMKRIDAYLVQEAHAPKRLVESSIWKEVIGQFDLYNSTLTDRCIIQWRKDVDQAHEREQRCEQLIAAVSAKGGCLADGHVRADAYVLTGKPSLEATVDAICDATFLIRHTDYALREFRERSKREHSSLSEKYRKLIHKRQALEAVPSESPHFAQAQALLTRI
jgi:hypothetical protein